MKIKMLFILLIGMVSLTSMASTPLMKQKQETTFTKVTDLNVVENVVLTDAIVSNESIIIYQSDNALNFKNVKEPGTYKANIADVGRRNSKQRFTNIFFTEKLLDNYDLKKKFVASKENRIRENPFKTQMVFRNKK